MKKQILVMPAWMAGTQVRKDAPETSMSAWIPALHAGMTESRGSIGTDRGPSAPYFQRRTRSSRRKKVNRKGPKSFQSEISGNFVAFVIFVLRVSFVKRNPREIFT
jgi:hypothetical protein